MANPVMGYQFKLGTAKETTEGTAVTATELSEVLSGDIGVTEANVNSAGLTGTRSHWALRTRAGTRKVQGSFTMTPTAKEWAFWLPKILGADASGTTFALTELLPSFTAVLQKDNSVDGKVFTYNGVKVNKAVISGSKGGTPLQLQVDLEGWDEAIGNAGTFPALTLDTTTVPFLFSDSSGAITVASVAYPFSSFKLTIDNHLDGERIMNSVIRSSLPAMDRTITLELDGPYGNDSAIYPTAATLVAGVACVLTFTCTTTEAISLSFSLPLVHFPRLSPKLNGRQEILLPLHGEARCTAALNELSVVLDSTP